jgi:hypothetical protein
VNFEKILRAKSGNIKLNYRQIEGLFFDLLNDLEKISSAIDKLNA